MPPMLRFMGAMSMRGEGGGLRICVLGHELVACSRLVVETDVGGPAIGAWVHTSLNVNADLHLCWGMCVPKRQ